MIISVIIHLDFLRRCEVAASSKDALLEVLAETHIRGSSLSLSGLDRCSATHCIAHNINVGKYTQEVRVVVLSGVEHPGSEMQCLYELYCAVRLRINKDATFVPTARGD